MTREPERWLDSAQDPKLAALMRAGAEELAPPEVVARVGKRLSASKVPLVLKGFGLALLLGGAGLGFYGSREQRVPPPPPVQTVQPAKPAQIAEPVVPVLVEPAVPPRRRRVAKVAAVEPAAVPSTVDPTMQPAVQPAVVEPAADTRLEEARLLERARRELAAHPAQTLALLREHSARFPASWLDEERAALSIRAHAQSGQRAAASAELARFKARYAGSVHTPALERLLARP